MYNVNCSEIHYTTVNQTRTAIKMKQVLLDGVALVISSAHRKNFM